MAIRRRGECWQAYWREPGSGKIRAKQFRGPDAKRQCQAFDLEIKRIKVLDPGGAVVPPQGQLKATVVVHDVILAYMEHHRAAGRPERYNVSDIYPLDAWVLPIIGEIPVADLTRAHIQEVIKSGLSRGLAGSTINRRLNVVSAALRWAESTGMIDGMPMQRIPRCPTKKTGSPAPTEAEIEAILAVSPGHLRRAVTLAWWTGIRPGAAELFALRWEHVEQNLEWILVPAAAKGGDPWREVPIHSRLRPFLETWRADDQNAGYSWIVHYRGQPVGSLRRAWSTALSRSGITRPIRLYDVRHAFVTRALEQGLDPGTIAAITGHSIDTMLRHYQHVRRTAKTRAISALDP